MTIKQLASELGVTKTTIRKYLTDEIRAEHTTVAKNGYIEISETGASLIAEAFRNHENRKLSKPDCEIPETDCEISITDCDIPETNCKPLRTDSTKFPQTDSAEFPQTDNKIPQTDSDTITMPIAVWETLQHQLEQQQKQIEEYSSRLQEVTQALLSAQDTAARAQTLHAVTVQEQLTSGETKRGGLLARLWKRKS